MTGCARRAPVCPRCAASDRTRYRCRTSCEHRRRLFQFAQSLQGADALRWVGDDHAIDGGKWQRSYLNAFSSTIGGGTSQIQANIIGERVLGLPKD